ncbi:MAG TPA: formimidoylglutamate deiminase [Caulobacteraceae bacterium]
MPSLWFETALLDEGWASDVRLTVLDGRIATIERAVPLSAEDEDHGVAIPGLCNVHSHAFQRGMAGLTENRGPLADDFWTWREWMYRFLDRMDPDDVQAIAAQAYAEMLQTGFTRVGEFHYLHHDPRGAPYSDLAEMAGRIVAAASDTGIGLTLLPVFYAHAGFGGAPPAPGQRRFINDLNRFEKLFDASRAALAPLADANLGIAPHSLRAVTPDELSRLLELFPSGPVHIHAAEQVREVEECLAWGGQRPVEWLLEHAHADERWCLIHATHLTNAEVERLAASRAVAGLCPVTEANLGDGIFPADAFLTIGGRFAVGTDSNVLIDPAQELRMLEYAQRLKARARNILASTSHASTGARLITGALAGGAQALGQGVFGLKVGAPADIVCLNPHHPSLYGRSRDALIDGWLFSGTPGLVTTVWRLGEKVVRHGRHCDAERIAARYRLTLDKLIAS